MCIQYLQITVKSLLFSFPPCRKKKKKPMAGFKSKKIQPQGDSDELPIITNIDDPWEEESEEDENVGVSINAAGKGTELVVLENGVKREEVVHASHDIHVEESAAISKSTSSSDAAGGDSSSPKVQVEAEVMPEMVALSVIAQQQVAEQDETAASGEVSVPEEGQGQGEGEREAAVVVAESEETREKEEGAGTIDEGPVVVIEESAEPIMTVEIQVSCCVSSYEEMKEGGREGERGRDRERAKGGEGGEGRKGERY